MARLLNGKVVIITGSTRHGAKLVLHHIGDEQARLDIIDLKKDIREFSKESNEVREIDIAADITDDEAGKSIVDAAVSAFGEVNGLVNNAGICQFKDFVAVSKSEAEKHMAVNYHGTFGITQAVVQQMILQGKGGSVVSIASVCATMGAAQLTHYSATKAAVLGMMSPGTVETTMNKEDLVGPKREWMESRVPLGRLGVPQDIARPVVFFISDMAQYVSGQNLIVDGASTVYYQ
ncbi:NAD(P)-binding protein [Annulohypoxylon moriforme]|nr:NAD(P)-binding protein [Annulohypoxylon moriforme]